MDRGLLEYSINTRRWVWDEDDVSSMDVTGNILYLLSGKSRLVNGLMARIDVSGGYVLSHKFGQMSQENSILEVVAMFNDLCQLIQDKNSQQDLLIIVDDLVRVFGADLSTLAWLLPNIKALTPHLKPSDDKQEIDNQMNV